MRPLRLWIGLVLLSLGVLGILDAIGVLESSESIGRWWPVAVIGAGVMIAIASKRLTLPSTFLIAIGFVLLADQMDWTDQDILGPALLVVIGGALLVGATTMRRARSGRLTPGEGPMALFGGSEVKERSQHFSHSEATALFGGAVLDLREAHIDKDASVDATAIFGGVDVLVPKGWRVKVHGLPIFGGYEDKTEGNGSLPVDAPTLDVRATAIFGGVDVAHQPD
jgi:cell wall-active antibiotic response 4TMS protein YvqF